MSSTIGSDNAETCLTSYCNCVLCSNFSSFDTHPLHLPPRSYLSLPDPSPHSHLDHDPDSLALLLQSGERRNLVLHAGS